jgi:predicted DNA binding protein
MQVKSFEINVKHISNLHEYLLNFGLPEFYINSNSKIDIVFNTELTEEQNTVLNNAINDYVDLNYTKEQFSIKTVSVNNSIVTNTNYTTVASDFWTVIINPEVYLEYVNIAVLILGSISIRIVDLSNNNTLYENSFTRNSTTLEIIKLNNLTNIPTTDTLIDFQVKTTQIDSKCITNSIQYVFYKYSL